jgi:hypothetical protein
MPFSHPYGAYSVEGSFNEWVRKTITAAGTPAWMPSARVLYDYPEAPLISGYAGHAFTVQHLGPPEPMQVFQGRRTQPGTIGQAMTNLAEVNCWISKQAAPGVYQQRLRQMGDMVEYLFTSGREIPLTNLYTGAAAPTAIGALIRLTPAVGQPVQNPDVKNPDYLRRRFTVAYWWVERVSG